ncbi:Hypothetical protein IALB_0965 [Ignavibacterium album JCM 16511]|uniref:Sulfatase-modifying factor enzyme-like domain-containing protein n=1 Tax=Ignavibacterium album (strain DSM 19864 / JCM 16511 / NBRC 101810 / Mat9-16) TaxID=945713 RepID=I0AI70_IGNAJ|nr:SUMF1/EgtB/PvdO family nonheme iron enzyme [Ignavibacterium album]AFH48677.1 Hypothetical protein IALB_0965 [Ignavibacterium album JCM 16511]
MNYSIKYHRLNYLLPTILFFLILFSVNNSLRPQSIKIVKIEQEEDSIKIVYNLISQREQEKYFVDLEVSKNGGLNYTIYPKALEGQVGYGISRGINKVIYWKPLEENLELIGEDFVFRINAAYLGSESEMQMIAFRGGSFDMGDAFNEGEVDEIPVHKVQIDDFEIGKYEVSNFQFAKFLNEYGSIFVNSGEFKGERMFYSQENGIVLVNRNIWKPAEGFEFYPVTGVTWFGANEFCKYYGYRLPTEAEWEYAARCSGDKLIYSSIVDSLDSKYFNYNAWFQFDSLNNSNNLSFLKSQSLGAYPPNDCGVFQMSGNVWEYCLDWYEWNYYADSPVENPAGPFLGKYKVIRGGGFTSSPKGIRVYERSYISPDSYGIDVGFRVARSINAEVQK